MYKENFKHFSLTEKWLKSKAKFSNWDIFISNNGNKHLIRRFGSIFALHWFSYIEKENLKQAIEATINAREKYFINLCILKLLNLPFIENQSRKPFLLSHTKQFKTLGSLDSDKRKEYQKNYYQENIEDIKAKKKKRYQNSKIRQ